MATILNLKVLMFTDQVKSTENTALRTPSEIKRVDYDQAQVTATVVAQYGGRILNDTGDGHFIEFQSGSDAVRCGFVLQNEVKARNATQNNERLRFELHVGIDLGEVVIAESGEIRGNAANIASRVASVCPVGEVFFTDKIRKEIHPLEAESESLPPTALKGVSDPPALHRLVRWVGRLEPTHNPFIWRGGITKAQDFFARVNEQDILIHFIRGGTNCQIVGERRIGKTSLLRQIERIASRLTERRSITIAYIDLQDPRCYTLSGWLKRVNDQFATAHCIGSLPDFAEWVEDSVMNGNRPVLCLDEFEEVARRRTEFKRDFFTSLRACGQQGLSIITASRTKLSQLTDPDDSVGSPFFNTFPILDLKKFSVDDAVDFVTTYRTAVPAFTSDEKEAVLRFADQHPLALQIACFHVLQAKQTATDLMTAIGRANLELSATLPMR